MCWSFERKIEWPLDSRKSTNDCLSPIAASCPRSQPPVPDRSLRVVGLVVGQEGTQFRIAANSPTLIAKPPRFDSRPFLLQGFFAPLPARLA